MEWITGVVECEVKSGELKIHNIPDYTQKYIFKKMYVFEMHIQFGLHILTIYVMHICQSYLN